MKFQRFSQMCIRRTTKQDRQCNYNVRLWRVHVIVLAIEMQQCFPFFTVVDLYVAVNNSNPFSIVKEKQKWVPFALLSS
jgi:hypothetical protein